MTTAAESAVCPCLEALISHGTMPPLLTLVVEGLQQLELPTKSLPAIRLLLGDGQLCIQALLHTRLHSLASTGVVVVGAIVALSHYEVVVKDTHDSNPLIFLDVERLEVVGQWKGGGDPKERQIRGEKEGDAATVGDKQGQGDNTVSTVDSFSDVQFNDSFFEQSSPTLTQLNFNGETQLAETPAPIAAPIPPIAPALNSPSPIKPQHVTTNYPLPKPLPFYKPSLDLSTTPAIRPIALFRKWHNIQHPLKLTTLGSVPYLPYKLNWTCNILAIIISLNPVEPGTLAPLQRIARLIDPTVAMPMRLTVFLNPQEFTPPLGVPVLLVGVKNHTYEGGSLNKYESDKPLKGQRWWYTDLGQFPWCNADELLRWWNSDVEDNKQAR
ncbi:hypothetical protein Cpir12675_003872 [Ceratocystis pirilliformis]|uniref:Uncharacterized protein n=1 Tax=Ceratocystis pirilliformis TaxID=259994 RepID=A0ABR3YZX4_9PEZI